MRTRWFVDALLIPASTLFLVAWFGYHLGAWVAEVMR